jgi:hypothetical protein
VLAPSSIPTNAARADNRFRNLAISDWDDLQEKPCAEQHLQM